MAGAREYVPWQIGEGVCRWGPGSFPGCRPGSWNRNPIPRSSGVYVAPFGEIGSSGGDRCYR
jgi:hypothetical protein